MSDAAVAVPVAPKATPKKVKAVKAKPVKTSSHPSYQDMIKKAIETLKERNGSSRQAIQKYIQASFKTCDDKLSQAHLKIALKRAADAGLLKRVTGTGASGSFRLNPVAAAPKKPKAAKAPKKALKTKKTVAAKKPKVAGEKKVKAAKPKSVKTKSPVKAKKAVAEKKTTAKPKIVKKPATPKKAVKPAVKKTTTPKAKKPAVKKAPVKK